MVSYILAVITGVLVLAGDQFVKYCVSTSFQMEETANLIPGFVKLFYISNDGGAWGMLGGYTWILLSITIVIMLVCIALLLKVGLKDKIMFWAIILVLAGGLGNMIDRIFRGGNVIDFLQFEFWPSFPVFNIADCAVVVGAGLMLLYFFKSLLDENRQKRAATNKIVAEVQKNEED